MAPRRNKPQPGAIRRAAIYYRVSTEEQIDGYSLDEQRIALEEFCAAKGWTIVATYAEEGKSARSDNIAKRPQFQQLLDDAEAGLFEVVVVHKLDRFSRSILVTFNSLARLEECDVAFTTVVEDKFDFTTPQGKVMLSLLAAFAQYYSDNLSFETKKGKEGRKREGLHNGHIPWGMTRGDDGIAMSNPDTEAGLLLAFTLAAQGQSDLDVAQALNTAGYRTTGVRKGTPMVFSKDTVCRMLQNRFYLGELPGEVPTGAAPAKHKAVIDAALFDAARREREQRATTSRSTVRRDRSTFSLSGLLRCGKCGGTFNLQTTKGGVRCYCTTKKQSRGCDAPSVLLAGIEAQVAEHLATFTIPADYRERLRAYVTHAQPEVTDTAAQRRRLENRLERAKELYGWGDRERAAYLAERDGLAREIATLDARETGDNTHLDRLAGLLADAAQGWERATQGQRNELARTLFEEIVVGHEEAVAVKPRPELAGFFTLDNQFRDAECQAPLVLAEVTGFEPAVSALTGQRVRPLHHTSVQTEY